MTMASIWKNVENCKVDGGDEADGSQEAGGGDKADDWYKFERNKVVISDT